MRRYKCRKREIRLFFPWHGVDRSSVHQMAPQRKHPLLWPPRGKWVIQPIGTPVHLKPLKDGETGLYVSFVRHKPVPGWDMWSFKNKKSWKFLFAKYRYEKAYDYVIVHDAVTNAAICPPISWWGADRFKRVSIYGEIVGPRTTWWLSRMLYPVQAWYPIEGQHWFIQGGPIDKWRPGDCWDPFTTFENFPHEYRMQRQIRRGSWSLPPIEKWATRRPKTDKKAWERLQMLIRLIAKARLILRPYQKPDGRWQIGNPAPMVCAGGAPDVFYILRDKFGQRTPKERSWNQFTKMEQTWRVFVPGVEVPGRVPTDLAYKTSIFSTADGPEKYKTESEDEVPRVMVFPIDGLRLDLMEAILADKARPAIISGLPLSPTGVFLARELRRRSRILWWLPNSRAETILWRWLRTHTPPKGSLKVWDEIVKELDNDRSSSGTAVDERVAPEVQSSQAKDWVRDATRWPLWTPSGNRQADSGAGPEDQENHLQLDLPGDPPPETPRQD